MKHSQSFTTVYLTVDWLEHHTGKKDAEKKILYSLSIHKSQCTKLCIIFTFDTNSECAKI